MGRKFLMVMMGVATVGVDIRLSMYIYRWVSTEYENVFVFAI